MTPLTDAAETALANPAVDILPASILRALFLRPRLEVDSPALPHSPFLLWLSAVAQPRRIAVLGADDGHVHFLFCQALDKANIPGRVLGAGFWKEPRTGASAKVPAALADHERQFYEELSDLRAFPDMASATAALLPQGIDLLFVDLETYPDGAQPDGARWLDALRPDALIVLHGTNALPSRPRLQAALAMLGLSRRRIDFRKGRGLAILLRPEAAPPRLQGMLAACDMGEVPADVAAIFRRLGRTLVAEAEARTLRIRERTATKAQAELRQALEAAQGELALLRDSHALQGRKLAEAQSDLFDARADLDAEGTVRADLATRLDEAAAAADATAAALAEAKAQAEAERRQRFEEVATMTILLEEERVAAAKREASLTERIAALNADLESAAEAHRLALQAAQETAERHVNQMTALESDFLEMLEAEQRAAAEAAALAEQRLADVTARAEAGLQMQIDESAAAIAALEEGLAAARMQIAVSTSELANLRDEAAHLRQALQAAEDLRMKEAHEANAALSTANRQRDEVEAALSASLLRAAEAEDRAEAANRIRFDETAVLTRLLEEKRSATEALQSAADARLEEERKALQTAADARLKAERAATRSAVESASRAERRLAEMTTQLEAANARVVLRDERLRVLSLALAESEARGRAASGAPGRWLADPLRKFRRNDRS